MNLLLFESFFLKNKLCTTIILCATLITYVVSWLPQVRNGQGKILQGQGKVSEFYFESGEIEILTEKSGKFEIITL